MKKYIAYEKLSKKEKRKIDNGRRKTWGDLNPVTRKPTSSRAYNRKKNQHWKDETHGADSFLVRGVNFPVHDILIRFAPYSCLWKLLAAPNGELGNSTTM